MKKKSKKGLDFGRSESFFNNLDIKGFKREAVIRGMPFDDVLDADVPALYTYIVNHFNDEKHPELLDQFDDHVEAILRKNMRDDLIHPSLRLGFIGERDFDTGMITKIKRIAGMAREKKRKSRAPKNVYGVVGGTAKALTFELYYKGKDKQETIKTVLEKFPNTSDKSVGIWWNKAKRKSSVNLEEDE